MTREQRKVVIAGWGLVSPLGYSAWETFSSILAGKTLADRAAQLPIDIAPFDLVRALGSIGVGQYTHYDPAVELAERAAREAMFMAKAHADQIDAVLGTSKGAVHALSSAMGIVTDGLSKRAVMGYPGYPGGPGGDDAALAVALGPHGYLAGHLRRRLGLHGTPNTVVAACASSLTALHWARLRMAHCRPQKQRRQMLVMTCEASLLPLFVHSYRRLGVLPPLTRDGYRARPLDQTRCGFMLADVAAAVVLEEVDQPQPGQIELVDTAIASDGYDLVRTAPGMPALSHIANKLLSDRTIDVLHPHATATAQHDCAELAAYTPHLSGDVDVYACKGALGHGLGAAGLVGLIVACMCAKTGRRPPMPWLKQPIDTSGSKISIRSRTGACGSNHAVFAGGFGGHVAGAVLRKIEN